MTAAEFLETTPFKLNTVPFFRSLADLEINVTDLQELEPSFDLPGFGQWIKANVTEKPVLRSLANTPEEEISWLIPDYIPSGQLTLLVGDGGVGKSAVWCNLVAGITSGQRTVLEQDIPFSRGDRQLCMFFSAEDSAAAVLKKRLRKAGADEKRILFADLADDQFRDIKFGSVILEQLISEYRPALCVFDPLQSFIPADVQMSSRNAMRQCLSPLASLGEKYGTAFLIVMHTNKKLQVSGRGRCADSSDIWDISRSVLIAGDAGDGLHYLSHEKSNYGALEETVLYSIGDGGTVCYKGTTAKKDRDFVAEHSQAIRAAPARQEARQMILDFLEDGEEHEVAELDDAMKASGVSFSTLKRTKTELKTEGLITYRAEGYGQNKKFYVRGSDFKWSSKA